MPPCLLIQAMGQIANNQKNTFYTTAEENEALGMTSERGLTSHEVFMCFIWLLLACSSV